MINPNPQANYQQTYGFGPEEDTDNSEFGKLPCPVRVTDNVLGPSPRHGYKGRTAREPGTQIRG